MRPTIGASEVPGLLLPDYFFSAGDLWAWARGLVERPTKPTPAQRLGLLCEPALYQALAEEGIVGERQVRIEQERAYGVFRATPDLLEEPTHEPRDLKTSGLIGPPPDFDEWGEDTPPRAVTIQLHAQMLAVGHSLGKMPERAHCTALLGRRGIVHYTIPRSDDLIAIVDEYVDRFLASCHTDTPMSAPQIDVSNKIPRVEGREVALPEDWLRRKCELREARLKIASEEKDIERRIRGMMATAGATIGRGGLFVARYTTVKKRVVDVERLRAAGVYDQWLRESVEHRLDIKERRF